MAEIINQIIAFFTSDEFQALMTSIGSLLLAVSPFLFKLITSKIEKWKIKFQAKASEVAEALKLVDEYKKLAEAEAAKTKQTIDQLTELVNKQNEAMRLAFDRSNLKEDTKQAIHKILQVQTVKIPVEPLLEAAKTVLKEDEKKKDDSLSTQTPVEELEEEPQYTRIFK
ncbi:MAG TPA: hypothetical protein P5570_02190 [Candidatus Paceibacterota bacterium]|nr:hypothetical protein [Candidatus Paceibacterota bacterium]